MIALLAETPHRVIGSTFLGIIILAAVFFISFFWAYRLYRHFTNIKDDAE